MMRTDVDRKQLIQTMVGVTREFSRQFVFHEPELGMPQITHLVRCSDRYRQGKMLWPKRRIIIKMNWLYALLLQVPFFMVASCFERNSKEKREDAREDGNDMLRCRHEYWWLRNVVTETAAVPSCLTWPLSGHGTFFSKLNLTNNFSNKNDTHHWQGSFLLWSQNKSNSTFIICLVAVWCTLGPLAQPFLSMAQMNENHMHCHCCSHHHHPFFPTKNAILTIGKFSSLSLSFMS